MRQSSNKSAGQTEETEQRQKEVIQPWQNFSVNSLALTSE